MAFPSKSKVYSKLQDAALIGDNVAFLEAHRMLNVHLIKDAEGDASEQARISSELLRVTKELVILKGRGDQGEPGEFNGIGLIGLEDV